MGESLDVEYGIKASSVMSFFEYDPENGNLRWVKNSPRSKRVGLFAGTKTKWGYVVGFKNNMIPHARLVWAWCNGEWPDGIVRRLNGDFFDDRIENLFTVKQPMTKDPTAAELIQIFGYDDGNLIWKRPLSRRIKAGSVAGTMTKTGVYVMIQGRQIPAFKIIWAILVGFWPKKRQIIHKNGDVFDNRIENLIISEKWVDNT